MPWLRAYPRSALIALAVTLIVIGSLVIARKSPMETSPSYSTVSEESAFVESPFPYDTAPIAEEGVLKLIPPSLMQSVVSSPPFSYSSPFISREAKPAPSVVPSNTSSAEVKKTPEITDGANFWNAYSLTPRGLISTSIAIKTRTPEEKALFDYGNELGLYIGAFEDAHQNTVSSFQDFFSARGATPSGELGGLKAGSQPKPAPPPADGGLSAIERITSTARDYSRLGDTIANMSSVPKDAQRLHLTLSQGYGEIGAGLSAIVQPNGGDLAKAVLAYNESADKFIRNFVSLAEFFGARGIKFSSSDPGNIFSFSATGGL